MRLRPNSSFRSQICTNSICSLCRAADMVLLPSPSPRIPNLNFSMFLLLIKNPRFVGCRTFYSFLIDTHPLIPFVHSGIILCCQRINFSKILSFWERNIEQQLPPMTVEQNLLKTCPTKSRSNFGPVFKLMRMVLEIFFLLIFILDQLCCQNHEIDIFHFFRYIAMLLIKCIEEIVEHIDG